MKKRRWRLEKAQKIKFKTHYIKFLEAFAQAKKENPEMYGDIELMYSAGVDDGDSDKSMYPEAYQNALGTKFNLV